MIRAISLIFLTGLIISCNEKPGQENKLKSPVKRTNIGNTKAKEKPRSYSGLIYSIIKERKTRVLKNDSLKKIINTWLGKKSEVNIEELTDHILQLTANQLTFSFGKCSSDPESLIKKGDANCIGYSALFNSLMNYALQLKPFSKKYQCRHYVGKIYFAGQNINALFNDPFFKDHDFNIIKSTDGETEIAVDPSLYEYLSVKRVLVKK